METPKTANSNTPQKVLKSIEPQESITVNISKEVNGEGLENVLKGVTAFTGVFNKTDKYNLSVCVNKIIDNEVSDNDSNNTSSNEENLCNGERA